MHLCRLAGGLAVTLALGACATPTTEVRRSPQMPPTAESLPTPTRPRPVPGATPVPAAPAPRSPVIERPPTPTTIERLPQPAQLTRASIERYIPSRAKDRAGWALDIAEAFSALRIAPSEENICSVVAITDQESLFVADPPVPGLARIVWKEIESRRARYAIPKPVLDAALLTRSPDGRSYRKRIDALRTETQMNALYQDMIAELPFGPTLLASRNPVRTGGPMQVSIAFAEAQARRARYPYPVARSIRDEVFTRRGGIYFGTAILLDYPVDYRDPVFRFADFNAGRYSSRNAAFQIALSRASGHELVPDGDLLRYRNGRPSGEPSKVELALEATADRLKLSMSAIRRDLALEKTPDFGETRTYQRVFALAERRGKALPRAVIPRIRLKGPKISRKLTTEWFAKRVKWRYGHCLKRGRG